MAASITDMVPEEMQESEVTLSKRTTRRIGYGVAIAVNAVMLVIANNILEWGWFGWLTEDLNDVLPLINLSLIVSMVINAVYVVNDGRVLKRTLELVDHSISLVVAIRLLQVFPFDYSEYGSGWETVTRWILIVAIVGVSLAMLARVAQLLQALARFAGEYEQDHSSGQQ